MRGRAADRRVARRARLRARVAQPGEALLRFCASASDSDSDSDSGVGMIRPTSKPYRPNGMPIRTARSNRAACRRARCIERHARRRCVASGSGPARRLGPTSRAAARRALAGAR
ncbi:conserved hypothetical protein [Burkholderia mallei PRL-20]|nr:hypothetical protein BMASAVP1_A2831 [Burkholderia mallei SAVP1]ABO04862.1 hypothetical protein BMA10247_2328 [Burkholderia mallei NCTC 10247]ABO06952.1 hypothetical protein BMA10247_2305 [Burkholderia mallei NCTC 10247]EEP87022.1 conserved hypothetical protein [Burkholderia mallei GB8 horse 4]EES45176.1 conserved hypothetical protein [Burkholderia mallei PRL-20]